jgi:hypothetical protein
MTTITFKQTECVIQHEPDQRTILPPLPDTTDWPDPKPVLNQPPQKNDGKCTITAKFPLPTKPANADYLITEFHDNSEPWKIDLAELFIKLGQKVIETEQCNRWLTMTQVSALCRRYRLNWKKQTTTAKHLQRFGREYFDRHTDIMGGGVKVEYRTEWNEGRTRELMFLQFRRLYPDGHCH